METYELLISNTNHVDQMPHTLITSASYNLVDYLMTSLGVIFKDMGYKSFRLQLKHVQTNYTIRDEKSA